MNELIEKLIEISNIKGALSVLGWDQQVYMPVKGSIARGMQLSTLSGISHEKFTSKEMGNLLKTLKDDSNYNKLNENDKIIVDRTYEDYEQATKFPLDFVMKLTKAESEAFSAWEYARKQNNYEEFKPHLKIMVDFGKKMADIIGYETSPYNALLDQFEKDMTVEELNPLFANLKEQIVPFLEAIKNSNIKTSPEITKKHYPHNKQWDFTIEILKTMGYDFEKGRQDKSTHPFTINFHPDDVRITTRIDENYICDSVSGTIHEGGHALYEQGLLSEFYGTPLCDAASLGVHESQSRMWENLVGRSISFWKYFYPKIKKYFPDTLKGIELKDFVSSYNHVEPGFIRVEADEVTYNLHVLLRYEIERDVIEGKIKVDDMKELWNSKMKEYLGITPKDDKTGILQDVHWSGTMGYFPTYTLGNLYSAQLYHKALEENPNMESEFEQGNFSTLLKWLREKVHRHGRRYTPKNLIKHATGEEPSADYFINHIYNRYGEIYEIARVMGF
jgi:carboxypeptidase Taq